MYFDYSNLWKLLIDKKMSKSDLMEATGISSRVIAKLTKNQTVTTDTLLRICEVFSCDVSAIMACVSDEKQSLFETYRTEGIVTDKTDLYKEVVFTKDGKKYKVYETLERAGKSTDIECRDHTIYWVQCYILAGMSKPYRTEQPLVTLAPSSDETVIFVYKGTPRTVTGQNDGIFTSGRSDAKETPSVYVLSESAFKLFSLS